MVVLTGNVADPFFSLVTTTLRIAAPSSQAQLSLAFTSTDRPQTQLPALSLANLLDQSYQQPLSRLSLINSHNAPVPLCIVRYLAEACYALGS
ncbi:hypothetical protein KCU65_g375, partial [Aureobasidium melanogenum]